MSQSSEDLLLEEFHKISTSDKIDVLAIETFCNLVYEDQNKIDKAIKLIENLIASKNYDQITRAIEILNECMPKCGEEFRKKIGKFNFLNKLIKVVSTKYDGNQTPRDIKDKIMDSLLLWKTEYPDKDKIKEAYVMLKKECNHKITPTSVTTNIPRKCDFFDASTDEKLNKLLKSGNPEDLRLANILIKRCVEQDAKKNELIHRQKTELSEAKESIELLNEMIESYSKGDFSTEDLELIAEIYDRCKKISVIVRRLPDSIDETQDELMDDALFVNDKLTEIINKYEELHIFDKEANNGTIVAATNTASTTTLPKEKASTGVKENTKSDILIDDFPNLEIPKTLESPSLSTDIDCLKEIFDNPLPSLLHDLPSTALKPVPIVKDNNKINSVPLQENNESENDNIKKSKNELIDLVDKKTEELFKENLKTVHRIGNFNKKSEKVSLNDLKQIYRKDASLNNSKTGDYNKISETKEDSCNIINTKPQNSLGNLIDIQKSDNSLTLTGDDLDKLDGNNIDYLLGDIKQHDLVANKKIEITTETKIETKIDSEDEEMISGVGSDNVDIVQQRHMEDNKNQKVDDLINSTTTTTTTTKNVSKNLSDISLELHSVKISRKNKLFKILDDDQGLLMKIGFTDNNNFGSDIYVLLISINNQSEFAINNFHLEAGVPKPCKVRLLTPSATSLQGTEPLKLPTQDIKQILLLFNPTKEPIDITFIISYNLNDECDAFKQPVIAKNIPYLN